MPTSCARKVAVNAVALCWLCIALPASAQDALAAARAKLDAARFAEAVRLYDQIAEADEGLDRDGLMRLLRDRALARAALRDREGARLDLAALFSLDPNAELGPEAPPSLRRLADEVRAESPGRLTLRAEAVPVEGGFEIRTEVESDPAQLVRSVRVLELGDGGVQTHTGREVRIETEGQLRYVVEAIGGGGAVLASVGTPSAPRTVGSIPLAPRMVPDSSDDDTGLWVGIGIGTGIVAAVAVAIAIVLTVPSDETQPSFPMEIP